MSRSALHQIWKAALEAAALPTRWGVHAIRHSYAVEVYRKTRDHQLTQRLLGRRSSQSTRRHQTGSGADLAASFSDLFFNVQPVAREKRSKKARIGYFQPSCSTRERRETQ